MYSQRLPNEIKKNASFFLALAFLTRINHSHQLAEPVQSAMKGLLGMKQIESPPHKPVRTFLRRAGPVTAGAGIVLIAIGFISFFSAMGDYGPPKYFWCAFVGMPLLFVGIVMTKAGYIGAVARYLAAETAPVAKDTVNYMAQETKDAVKTVAQATAEGVRDGLKEPPKS